MPFSLRFTALVLTICLAIGALVHGRANTEDELIETVSKGWNANRQSFKRFTCRYTIIKGTAPSREDALQGKLLESAKANCLWVVDGNKERCSLTAEHEEKPTLPPVAEGQRAGVIAIKTFLSENYLAYGRLRMHSSKGGGTLYGEKYTDEHNNSISTPFSMGVMGPGETADPPRMIKRLSEINGSIVIVDHLDEGTGISLDYSTPVEPNKPVSGSQYVFEPSKGFLTMHITRHSGSPPIPNMEVVITEVKQLNGVGAFPMRSVRISYPKNGAGIVGVSIIEVDEIDVSDAPSPDLFALQFKKGWHINDRTDPYSQFYLKEDQKISATDLPKLLQRAEETARQRHANALNK